jgi:ADP-ribosylglycohydrolase
MGDFFCELHESPQLLYTQNIAHSLVLLRAVLEAEKYEWVNKVDTIESHLFAYNETRKRIGDGISIKLNIQRKRAIRSREKAAKSRAELAAKMEKARIATPPMSPSLQEPPLLAEQKKLLLEKPVESEAASTAPTLQEVRTQFAELTPKISTVPQLAELTAKVITIQEGLAQLAELQEKVDEAAKKRSRSALQEENSTFTRSLKNSMDVAGDEDAYGPVVRAWPLGLLLSDKDLLETARAQSELTHRSPVAQTGSILIAQAISLVLKNKTIDPIKLIDLLIDYLKQHNLEGYMSYWNLLHDVKRWIEEKKEPKDLFGWDDYLGNSKRSKFGRVWGIVPEETVALALYIFCRHSTDLHAALVEAANMAGAPHAVATLVGALVGTRTGWRAFEDFGFNISALEGLSELNELIERTYRARINRTVDSPDR